MAGNPEGQKQSQTGQKSDGKMRYHHIPVGIGSGPYRKQINFSYGAETLGADIHFSPSGLHDVDGLVVKNLPVCHRQDTNLDRQGKNNTDTASDRTDTADKVGHNGKA